MFRVPVTFAFDFHALPDGMRPWVMHEFAVNGAEHLVLTSELVQQILQNPPLEKKLMDELAAEGLDFVDSHAPFLPGMDFNCPEESFRPKMLRWNRMYLEIAADMGVDTMTFHIGNIQGLPPADIPFEQHITNIERTLDALLPAAEKLGIVLCMENIWYPTNTPEVLNGLKAKFPTDFLGLCYDAGHANLMVRPVGDPKEDRGVQAWSAIGVNPPPWEEHALEKMLPHVVNCHLHDNMGWRDFHMNPGTGTVDWPHIVGLLKRAPRLRSIQSEVSPFRNLGGKPQAIRDICDVFLHRLPEM